MARSPSSSRSRKPGTRKPTRRNPGTKPSAPRKAESKATSKKTARRKSTAKPASRKTATRKTAAKPAARKTATRKTAAKPAARKTATRKTAAKPASRKTAARKTAAKPAARKTAARKAAARKTAARKAAARKAAARKAASHKSASETKRRPAPDLSRGPQVPTARTPKLTSKRADTLLRIEEAVGERIVGKRDAIAKIGRVIRVRLTQLDFRPERPNGSFLLVGPPGVGKNEFAYALSEVLFGTDERVVSIDLGEIAEEEDMAKLGPSPVPGTENQVFEGMLTSPVRKDPEAILLLRSIERAHVAFQRLLVQILETGSVEDMLGPVDFRQTIVFVTTHTHRDEPTPSEIGFTRPQRSAEDLLRARLESFLLPDLLDSFNEVIELPVLSLRDVREIARYKVGKVLARMEKRKKAIYVSDSVYDELISDDLCKENGAKFLNRTLEERLFNPLARYLLEHRATREIEIGIDHGQITISNHDD